MKGPSGFWDIEHRLAELSAEGDPLEKLSATVDFEIFLAVLAKAVRRSDPAKGGRPGFDLVLKFKMLVLQSLHGPSLQQVSSLVRDRLSWITVLRPRPRRRGAGRQHAVGFPRGADRGPDPGRIVRPS